MMTTTAPPWLRRSDQAVTWARGMLSPHRAVVIDCETTDLPGAISGKVGYSNLRNRSEKKAAMPGEMRNEREGFSSTGGVHKPTESPV